MVMDPPIKPSDSDCCNSGCNPCILDVYEEQLRLYEQKLNHTEITYDNCISPTSYTIFQLVNIQSQSEDAYLYTFEYVEPLRGEKNYKDLSVQYKPGQHFLLKADEKHEEFTRAYTPIPIGDDPLRFVALIKLYRQGKMSDYLRMLQIGNRTLWRGPYGNFMINYDTKFMLLIAQGTGIAPIYSILYNIVKEEDCYTFLKLFYCCKDYKNIYLREQLYDLLSNWNFTYEVFLNTSEICPVKYNEMIHNKKLDCRDVKTYLLGKCETINVLICGSDNFMDNVRSYVLDCNVKTENIFTF